MSRWNTQLSASEATGGRTTVKANVDYYMGWEAEKVALRKLIKVEPLKRYDPKEVFRQVRQLPLARSQIEDSDCGLTHSSPHRGNSVGNGLGAGPLCLRSASGLFVGLRGWARAFAASDVLIHMHIVSAFTKTLHHTYPLPGNAALCRSELNLPALLPPLCRAPSTRARSQV